MTNPNNAVGTNAAYGTRTSVNAFNDFLQLVNGRGILSGWACSPVSGMKVQVGGISGTRDVAVAEDNLGNRTTINNRSGAPIEITLDAASTTANRYDAIVAYVNNPPQASSTTQDAPSACGIIKVNGGTTSVSEAQIRAAITADGAGGTTAYYVVLATIYVAQNTSTITSANISQSHIAISASDIADGEITAAMADFTTYTQTEKVVGKWIDGKTLYRKTLYVWSADHTGATVTMPIGASGNVDVVKIDAIIVSNGSGQTWQIPMYWSNEVRATIRADHTNVYVNVWSDSAVIYDSPCYATVYYTKSS